MEDHDEKGDGTPERGPKDGGTRSRKSRVTLSKEDLIEVKGFYEKIMAMAAVGLFYRTGRLIGARMWVRAKSTDMENVFRHLRQDGWIGALRVEGDHIDVSGSIEAGTSRGPACHILRGILTEILEQARGSKVYCQEVECVATGADHCRFHIQFGQE